jgi:hypothetical protein
MHLEQVGGPEQAAIVLPKNRQGHEASQDSVVRDLKNVAFAWHDEHRADRTNLEERVERLERHVGIERA